MIIYSNGCSHTNGLLIPITHTWPAIIMRSMVGKDYEFNEDGENMLINDALAGAGNDYIFHTTLESIEKLISKGKKPDYVFIQWSSPNRRYHINVDGKLFFITAHHYTHLNLKFEPMGSEHTIHYIFSLQQYLKKHKIKYYFFNYMGFDESINELYITKQIDFSRFIDFGLPNIINEGLIPTIIKNKLTYDERGHPNKDGHYFIAGEIGKKLKLKLIDKDLFYFNNKIL